MSYDEIINVMCKILTLNTIFTLNYHFIFKMEPIEKAIIKTLGIDPRHLTTQNSKAC